MKGNLIALAAAILCIIGLSGKAQAQGPPPITGAPGQVCQDPAAVSDYVNEYYPFAAPVHLNHDECVVVVSYLESLQMGDASMNRLAVAQCKAEETAGVYMEPNVTNYAQCVTYYEALSQSEKSSNSNIAPHLPGRSLGQDIQLAKRESSFSLHNPAEGQVTVCRNPGATTSSEEGRGGRLLASSRTGLFVPCGSCEPQFLRGRRKALQPF